MRRMSHWQPAVLAAAGLTLVLALLAACAVTPIQLPAADSGAKWLPDSRALGNKDGVEGQDRNPTVQVDRGAADAGVGERARDRGPQEGGPIPVNEEGSVGEAGPPPDGPPALDSAKPKADLMVPPKKDQR
jgi:hypothetical protein